MTYKANSTFFSKELNVKLFSKFSIKLSCLYLFFEYTSMCDKMSIGVIYKHAIEIESHLYKNGMNWKINFKSKLILFNHV